MKWFDSKQADSPLYCMAEEFHSGLHDSHFSKLFILGLSWFRSLSRERGKEYILDGMLNQDRTTVPPPLGHSRAQKLASRWHRLHPGEKKGQHTFILHLNKLKRNSVTLNWNGAILQQDKESSVWNLPELTQTLWKTEQMMFWDIYIERWTFKKAKSTSHPESACKYRNMYYALGWVCKLWHTTIIGNVPICMCTVDELSHDELL